MDVKLFNGVYTVTREKWTGSDPDRVGLLAAGYPPVFRPGRIPAVVAARDAAADFHGGVIATREIPAPDDPDGADDD